MKLKNLFATIGLCVAMLCMASCDASEDVNRNLRQQEGQFEIYREVTVINLRSDKILLEVEGYLAIKITDY